MFGTPKMIKRPKDMTEDELFALPDGPFLNHQSGPYQISGFEGDDIYVAVVRGKPYTFGQSANGEWYKEPYGL